MKLAAKFSASLVLIIASQALQFSAQASSHSCNELLESNDSWIISQEPIAKKYLVEAVSPEGSAPGSVMASPSRVNPNYYYHWVRDSALVMDELLNLAEAGDRHAQDRILQYIEISRQHQLTDNPSGPALGRGLGEPKFEMNGHAYTGGWNRPQNDGPALRATFFMRFFSKTTDAALRKNLITLIQADLDYVAKHWSEKSFDLWEEVMGDHFYTRMVQWRALKEGSEFNQALGSLDISAHYLEESKKIQSSLNSFSNFSLGFVQVTLPESVPHNPKPSQVDIAVILAVLHSKPDFSKKESFSVLDDRIIASAQKIEESFQNIYSVNQMKHDYEGNLLAPGIGRYPEDTYNGLIVGDRGNPWFLATQGMGEYYFKLAQAIINQGSFTISSINQNFVKHLGLNSVLAVGTTLKASDSNFNVLINAIFARGEAFVRRAHFHTELEGHQSEQFHRDTGFMQGAADLTWNYASFLSMMNARRLVQLRFSK